MSVRTCGGYRFASGVTLGGNYTWLDADRLDSTNPPTGDTYGDKLVAYARWEGSKRPIWVEYRFRWNGSTEANLDENEPVPPVGTELPSFTVHNLAAGTTVFERCPRNRRRCSPDEPLFASGP